MKIRYKIFFAIIVTVLLSVLALQQLQRYNFEQGLRRHSQSNMLERLQPLINALSTMYAHNKSWKALAGKPALPVREILSNTSDYSGTRHGFKFGDGSLFFGNLSDGSHRPHHPPKPFSRLSLLDRNKHWLGGARLQEESESKAISVAGEVVGYLAIAPSPAFTNRIDRRFSSQQTKGALWAIPIILTCAALFALLISRSLSRPIKIFVDKVQQLSDGQYNIRIADDRSNEFGALAKNLDNLAQALQDNQQHRRQWILDISHELRTPVAILKSEIECIEDGHQALDMCSLASLKSEVERLNLLIADLHQLAQSDSGTLTYNFQPFDICNDILTALNSYQDQFSQQQITVDSHLQNIPLIHGDAFRLRQVTNNLLQNTIRYTDSPGQLIVRGAVVENIVRLTFEDSSPSVSDEAIGYLFDRLYRVDPSRSRATGASGLGLSICASIIEAHQGRIVVEKSTLGGLAVIIELPIAPGNG